MRGLCQSVACSNHAGGIFYSVIASVARRSHINFTTIIKHIFHNFNNLRSTPVRVPMRGLCQPVGSSNPHKGDFVSPGALNIAENMPHYPTFWVRKSPIKIWALLSKNPTVAGNLFIFLLLGLVQFTADINKSEKFIHFISSLFLYRRHRVAI